MRPAYLSLPRIVASIALLLCITSPVLATDPPDTTQPERSERNILVEVRAGSVDRELTFALQAGYRWFKFLSTDLLGRTRPFTIHAGMTFSPVEFIFLQGSVGFGKKNEDESLHSSTFFDPDFFYGLRAGIRIPFNKEVGIVISSGTLWSVDWHYCYTCGFLHATRVAYRVELREVPIMELGLSIRM